MNVSFQLRDLTSCCHPTLFRTLSHSPAVVLDRTAMRLHLSQPANVQEKVELVAAAGSGVRAVAVLVVVVVVVRGAGLECW